MDVVITEDTIWMISATTLWIADFIETLPTEINVIWQKKPTGASVLSLINRYSLLLSLIFQTSLDLPGNQKDEQLVIDILQQITAQASSSAETQFQSFSACVVILSDSNSFNHVPFLALIYDIYIFGLTIRKTIELGFEMKRHGQSSVAHVILRDALLLTSISELCFYQQLLKLSYMGIVITSMTFLNYLIFVAFDLEKKKPGLGPQAQGFTKSSPSPEPSQALLKGWAFIKLKDQPQTAALVSGISSPFFDYLPNILISRLMLNLRTFPLPGTGDTLTTSQRAHLSSLHFASNQMLGNIGAPLNGGSFNEDEEEFNEVEIELETIREERQSLEAFLSRHHVQGFLNIEKNNYSCEIEV
ncbi:hypothetical protein F5050DRAFT_1857253 [Lentinula boryana]|uniref:DUF6533 domain-containing protein n=1 Tax=Lentinula boryana TaxID=40481 RepID=A0ABQ8Q197_9AGAR|nr:hypothetical protein F5050DRAFT_1857253 [Lentinula boryana]